MTTMVELAAELGKLLEHDSDPMRALLGRMLRLVMEAEASAVCGAEQGERSGQRTLMERQRPHLSEQHRRKSHLCRCSASLRKSSSTLRQVSST